MTPAQSPSGHEFLAHLPLIERVVASVVRRHGLRTDDAEDFASHVKLKFLQNGGEIFGKYRGESTLQTYLATVIARQCLDFRIAAWGKWRPSAAARRAGPTGVALERLMTRDGLSFDQACESLSTGGVRHSRQQLEALAAGFPVRLRRRFETDDALAETPSSEPCAEQLLGRRESAAMARRLGATLSRLVRALPPQDRRILKLRFVEQQPVSVIARRLDLNQKALYRRINHLLRGLRAALERERLEAGAVMGSLANHPPAIDWSRRRAAADETDERVRLQ